VNFFPFHLPLSRLVRSNMKLIVAFFDSSVFPDPIITFFFSTSWPFPSFLSLPFVCLKLS